MFSRKLTALNYHSPKEEVALNKTEDLKPLVVWLEDQKIRYYKIDDRKELRDATGKDWVAAFKLYLKTLECPYRVELDLPAAMDWLLGVAIRYEFDEIAGSNPDIRRGIGQKGSGTSLSRQLSLPSGGSALDIPATDPTFLSGTQALAKILQIAPHRDPTVLLKAARIVIQEKLAEPAKSKGDEGSTKDGVSKQYAITVKECGFDLGDPVLGEAAKVLRLLHLQELRRLQTRVNELIVAVQGITANPKTNQSLGKVGR